MVTELAVVLAATPPETGGGAFADWFVGLVRLGIIMVAIAVIALFSKFQFSRMLSITLIAVFAYALTVNNGAILAQLGNKVGGLLPVLFQ